jgi:hypothetical protein
MAQSGAHSRRSGTLDEPTVAADALCSVLEEIKGVERSLSGLSPAILTLASGRRAAVKGSSERCCSSFSNAKSANFRLSFSLESPRYNQELISNAVGPAKVERKMSPEVPRFLL